MLVGFNVDGDVSQNIAHDSRSVFSVSSNRKTQRGPYNNDSTRIFYVGVQGIVCPIDWHFFK